MTTITLRQAQKLLAFFGGEDCEVTITEQSQDGGTPGLYAHCTEYPEEGSAYLGPTEGTLDHERLEPDNHDYEDLVLPADIDGVLGAKRDAE